MAEGCDGWPGSRGAARTGMRVAGRSESGSTPTSLELCRRWAPSYRRVLSTETSHPTLRDSACSTTKTAGGFRTDSAGGCPNSDMGPGGPSESSRGGGGGAGWVGGWPAGLGQRSAPEASALHLPRSASYRPARWRPPAGALAGTGRGEPTLPVQGARRPFSPPQPKGARARLNHAPLPNRAGDDVAARSSLAPRARVAACLVRPRRSCMTSHYSHRHSGLTALAVRSNGRSSRRPATQYPGQGGPKRRRDGLRLREGGWWE